MKLGGGLKNNLGFCNGNPLLALCKDPHKQLLLDRIKLTNVPFVNAAAGFATHHLHSQQRGLPIDEEGVGYTKRPCCSAEREIMHQLELCTLFHELNLVEVRVAFANNAGGASLWTYKDCLRHSGDGENVGFEG